LGVLLVVHVALHWTWVCAIAHQLLRGTQAGPVGARTRHAYGAGFLLGLVLVLGGFTWYANKAVTPTGSQRLPESGAGLTGDDVSHRELDARNRDHDTHAGNHDAIRGSMTLEEVERETGVSVATLIAELNLPADTSPQDKLGRLGRQYGFEMDDVRALVAKTKSAQADE
jgi:hypothetical protein